MTALKKQVLKLFLFLLFLFSISTNGWCGFSAPPPVDSPSEFGLVLNEIKDIALPVLKIILGALKFAWKSVDAFFVTKYKVNQGIKSVWENHYVQKTTNFFWPTKQE